jgi:DNA-binding NarL/FixJ family response regulator
MHDDQHMSGYLPIANRCATDEYAQNSKQRLWEGKSSMSDTIHNVRSALIIEDHPLFTDALSMTLRCLLGIVILPTAGSLEAAVDHLSQNDLPELILLDLNLPDVNGLDGLIRIKAIAADVPLLVVSSMADNRMISYALRAGANGFIPKHAPRDTFGVAINAVLTGHRYTPDSFVDVTPPNQGEAAVTLLTSLTNQQARILQLICEGKLNKQIAYELSIAETTVKAHVTAIMRKLCVQSRTQAVLVAQEARFASVLPNETHAS